MNLVHPSILNKLINLIGILSSRMIIIECMLFMMISKHAVLDVLCVDIKRFDGLSLEGSTSRCA